MWIFIHGEFLSQQIEEKILHFHKYALNEILKSILMTLHDDGNHERNFRSIGVRNEMKYDEVKSRRVSVWQVPHMI